MTNQLSKKVNKSDLPNIKKGDGDNSVVINEGDANGKSSVAGGSTDKSLITDLVGTAGLLTSVNAPKANGNASLAFGASTIAHSTGAMALGAESEAGCLGYYFWNIDFTNNIITLSTNQKKIFASRTPPSNLSWAAGDIVSIINDSPYPMCCTITAVDKTNGTITVDSLPFSEIKDPTLLKPNDRSVYVIDKPSSGEVQMGFGAFSLGYSNIAGGPLSSAIGYENKALDTAAFVTGRENIGGWGSFVGGYKNEVLGDTASASGRSNKVLGNNASANGASNQAFGRNSKAEGLQTTAYGERAHSEGYSTTKLENIPTAPEEAITRFETEKFTLALGNQAHAEGRDTLALKDGSHAEGRETIADGLQAHAEGYRTWALANSAHAEGSSTKAIGVGSHAEGASTEAQGKNSHAEGIGTIAIGEGQHVSGKYNIPNSNALFILGNGRPETKNNLIEVYDNEIKINSNFDSDEITVSLDSGSGTRATLKPQSLKFSTEDGPESLKLQKEGVSLFSQEGDTNTKLTAYGLEIETFQEGAGGKRITYVLTSDKIKKIDELPTQFIGASGEGANAETFNGNNQAIGNYSHAEGYNTIASGKGAHTEGYIATSNGVEYPNEASGTGSHAEGCGTQAIGQGAHAEGSLSVNSSVAYPVIANGMGAHAEGRGTQAIGPSAHSEGYLTKAQAENAHAEGVRSEVRKTFEEDGTTIKAQASGGHAEGYSILEAEAKYAHGEGYRTIVTHPYQHVQGKYNSTANQPKNGYAHIVGNGSGTTDSARSNAHTLDWDGNAWFAGSVSGNLPEVSEEAGIIEPEKQYQLSGDGLELIHGHDNGSGGRRIIIKPSQGIHYIENNSGVEDTKIVSIDIQGNAHFEGKITLGKNDEEVALKSDIQAYIDKAILGGAW